MTQTVAGVKDKVDCNQPDPKAGQATTGGPSLPPCCSALATIPKLLLVTPTCIFFVGLRLITLKMTSNSVVLFGMLSLVAQFVYWSRIVSGLNQEHA